MERTPRRLEEIELPVPPRDEPCLTRLGQLVPLEGGEDLLRPADHLVGEAGETGDLDPVTLVGGTGHDLSQEYDLVAPFLDRDVVVPYPFEGHAQFGEFVVMGREEGSRPRCREDIFCHRPGDAETVEGARAPPDLVQLD